MISESIEMLIKRMSTHPDEFVNKEWNPVEHGAWSFEPFQDVRWGDLLKSLFQSGKEFLFTEEEQAMLKKAYGEILRARCHEAIVKELISGEKEKEADFKSKQMKLPYTTTFSNNIANLSRAQREEELKWLRESYEAYEANKNKGMLG